MRPAVPSGVDQLVLGTVQLGLAYGRHSTGSAPDLECCLGILDAAWDGGIRSFDTAEAYGEAADRLSGWIASRGIAQACHVITKVSPSTASDPRAVERAVARFPSVASCTVMTHGSVEAGAFASFAEVARRLGVLPGASVYGAGELEAMATAGAVRVQAPLNVFDTRQRDAARRKQVPLDGRSVFLQGVLLEPPDRAEARAPGTGRMAEAVQRSANAVGVPAAVALLGWAVHGLGDHDRVVVGVDRADELEPLLSAVSLRAEAVEAFALALGSEVGSWKPDERSLDPRTWKSP